MSPACYGHTVISYVNLPSPQGHKPCARGVPVFPRDGKFVREFTIATATLDRGSTGGLTLSRPDQACIYISESSTTLYGS